MGDCDVAGIGSGARAGGETGRGMVAVDWFVACGCGFAALFCAAARVDVARVREEICWLMFC